jgi:meso-butanediol dehydrogenase/(S,S)-butanediol dehydrogenase/diacetyl reductase
MSARLKGKVAIVTGAGRHGGLGEGIARRFVHEGANVMLADIGRPSGSLLPAEHIGTADELESVAAGLRQAAAGVDGAGQVATTTCDVRSEDEIRNSVADCVAKFGQLDIVVNNAGVGYLMKPLLDYSVEEWDLVLNVNLRGPFLFTKCAGAQMIEQHDAGLTTGGRIINIASVGAKRGTPHFVAYTSSKHGLLGLTRVAALELAAHGITVNAVCPNHVTTGLGARQNEYRSEFLGQSVDEMQQDRRDTIPLRRIGQPDDTANACVFLASDDADYITGEAMNVSGGEEMR